MRTVMHICSNLITKLIISNYKRITNDLRNELRHDHPQRRDLLLANKTGKYRQPRDGWGGKKVVNREFAVLREVSRQQPHKQNSN